MLPHKFFHWYANLPMKERTKDTGNGETLQEIYHKVKRIEDKIRPYAIQRDNLISRAVDYAIKKDLYANDNHGE